MLMTDLKENDFDKSNKSMDSIPVVSIANAVGSTMTFFCIDSCFFL
jgi:hypothetical protein